MRRFRRHGYCCAGRNVEATHWEGMADRSRTPAGTPSGGEFAARGHGEATGVALDDVGSDLYPNGRCSGCGHGVADDGRCPNDECTRFGDVVDPDVADAFERREMGAEPLDLSRSEHRDLLLDAMDEAVRAGDPPASILHVVASKLRDHGVETDSVQALLDARNARDLLADRWPAGTKDYDSDDGAVVRSWKGLGISPGEARRWKRAGITDPALANRLRRDEFAVRPEMLAMPHPDGGTVGERVASGDVEWFNAAAAVERLVREAAEVEELRVGF